MTLDPELCREGGRFWDAVVGWISHMQAHVSAFWCLSGTGNTCLLIETKTPWQTLEHSYAYRLRNKQSLATIQYNMCSSTGKVGCNMYSKRTRNIIFIQFPSLRWVRKTMWFNFPRVRKVRNNACHKMYCSILYLFRMYNRIGRVGVHSTSIGHWQSIHCAV